MTVDIKVENDLVTFTETKLNQPIIFKDEQGRSSPISRASQDIVTKWQMSPDDITIKLIDLSKRRAAINQRFTDELANIDSQINNLNSAVAAVQVARAQVANGQVDNI